LLSKKAFIAPESKAEIYSKVECFIKIKEIANVQNKMNLEYLKEYLKEYFFNRIELKHSNFMNF